MAGADYPRDPDASQRAAQLDERRAAARVAVRRRRQRIAALVVLVVAAGVIAGLVAAGGGGGGSGRGGGSAAGGSGGGAASVPATTATTSDAATTPTTTTPASDQPLDIDSARGKTQWPLTGAAARKARVPILMYHLVGEPKGQVAYPDLWVTPSGFEAQVRALDRAGFTAITMTELWDAWHGGGALPQRAVVFSFDDGDISQVMNAAPVLKAAGWPGVLNLTLNHVGNDGLPRWGVKRMLRQGWELGSHSVTHPDLTTLGAEQLRRELVGSRKEITAEFGAGVDFFCYPAGRQNATVREAVKAAGYRGATTTEPGLAARADDPFALPRVRVQSSTTPAQLVELARG